MVIDSGEAKQFIKGYTGLLAQVHLLTGGATKVEMGAMLVGARHKIAADPGLLERAIAKLVERGEAPDEDLLEAFHTLKVQNWIFLKDTTRYSIFIDAEGKEAYAVLGLTDRVSEIVGGAGMVLQVGVVHYKGKYVCDGLVTNVAALGPNYCSSFADLYKKLKRSGHFHTA